MGGAHGQTDQGRALDDGRSHELSGQASCRLQFDDAPAQSSDDAPAAGVGAEGDGRGGQEDHPEGDLKLRKVARRNQGECERKAAVRTCSLRNVRLTGVGRSCKRCTTRISRIAKTAEAMKPSGGEITRLAICLPNAAHFTPPRPPAAAMPAPQRPPMSAWVELLGSPRYQVIRFHEIAPIRAAITTTSPGLMASVLAMVLETFAWKKATVTTAPTRLNKAESPTAT